MGKSTVEQMVATDQVSLSVQSNEAGVILTQPKRFWDTSVDLWLPSASYYCFMQASADSI